MALNARQQKFIAAYLALGNASVAAREAGYTSRRADQAGHQLLRNSEVQKALQERQKALAGQYEANQETVLAELSQIAFSDLGAYVRWDSHGVTLTPSSALSLEQRKGVKCVTATTTLEGNTTVRIALHDKVSALRDLCKILGLYATTHVAVDTWTEPSASAQAVQAELLRRLDALAATDHKAAEYRSNGRR